MSVKKTTTKVVKKNKVSAKTKAAVEVQPEPKETVDSEVEDTTTVEEENKYLGDLLDTTPTETVEEPLNELRRLLSINSDYDEIAKQKAILVKAIDDRNKEIATATYSDLMFSINPVKELVERMEFTKLTLKEERSDVGTITGYKIGYATQHFSLEMLRRENRDLISPCFFRRVDLLGKRLFDKVKDSMELEVNKKNTYKLATSPEENEKPQELSMKTIIREIQKDIDDMLFIGNGKFNQLKVTSFDVNWLLAVLFKHGNSLQSISMPRYETILFRMVEVANKLLLDKKYTAE